MPIYEYACEKCGSEFEVEQRITDDPVKTCPSCRSRKVKRLISRTSFVLKGGGWYSDLYSSSKPDDKPAEKSDAGGDADKGADAKPAKVDAKPDSGKSDAKPSKAADASGTGKGKGKKAVA